MTAPSHVRCISIALKILTFIFLIERWVFGFDSLLLLRQVVVPLIGCHSCWAWATLTHFLEVGNMATSASASTLPGFSCDAAVKKGRIASQFSFSLDSSLVTLVHRLGYSKQDIKCTLFKLFAIEAVTGRRGKFRVRSYTACLMNWYELCSASEGKGLQFLQKAWTLTFSGKNHVSSSLLCMPPSISLILK